MPRSFPFVCLAAIAGGLDAVPSLGDRFRAHGSCSEQL